MNNEELTITNASADVPLEHLPEQEKEKDNQEKPPVKENEVKSGKERKLERLAILKEQYETSSRTLEAAQRRTQLLSDRIAKVKNEIRSEEIAALDNACGEKKLSYEELTDFIRTIPDDMTLGEIKKMIS